MDWRACSDEQRWHLPLSSTPAPCCTSHVLAHKPPALKHLQASRHVRAPACPWCCSGMAPGARMYTPRQARPYPGASAGARAAGSGGGAGSTSNESDSSRFFLSFIQIMPVLLLILFSWLSCKWRGHPWHETWCLLCQRVHNNASSYDQSTWQQAMIPVLYDPLWHFVGKAAAHCPTSFEACTSCRIFDGSSPAYALFMSAGGGQGVPPCSALTE